MVELTPAAGEPEFGDPAMTGEWAAVLPDMVEAPQVAPWCAYAVRSEGRLVGLGSFKGSPDANGMAEIAYLTFVPDQGRGLAQAIAAELLDVARAAGATGVVAHTLPETNASTRVLTANRFEHEGAVEDAEDGTVWRWRRRW